MMEDALRRKLRASAYTAGGPDYRKLFRAVSRALFKAHVGGELKKEVMADPAKFVRLDPDLAVT